MRSGKKWLFWGLLTIVLAPLGLAALLVALPSGQASPSEDDSHLRELREMIVAGRPESENAWPAIEAAHERAMSIAMETMSPAAAKSLAYGVWRLNTGEWDDPEHADARVMLERLGSVLDTLDGDLRGTFALAPPRKGSSETMGSLLPRGASRAFTSLAQLNISQMRAAAADGRWDEVERALDRAVRLSRAVAAPTAIATMLSESLIGVTMKEAVHLIREGSPDAATIDRLVWIVEADEARGRDAGAICRGERLTWLNMMRSSYSDDGLAVPWGDEDPSLWERMRNVRAYSMPRWPDVERDITNEFTALEAWLVAPPGERGQWPKSEALVRYAETLGFPEVDDPLLGVAKPIVASLRGPVAFAAALRVYAFHARHARWPESLEEAAPDRRFVDPLTGNAFQYKLEVTDGAPTGFQVLLNGPQPIVLPGRTRRPLDALTELERDLLAQPPEPLAERPHPGN